MTTGVDPQKARRTQAERSAAMRARLLDATIDCLVTYGYAGTTTPRVAERAGVTRGAQIHHFRSKEDLVVAAIEHLAQQRAQAAVRELGRVQASPDPVATVLEFLWEAHQGPLFVASVELWVAARTDPVLAREIERVEPVVNSTLVAAIAQLIPEQAAQKEIRNSIYTAMDALRGILVASFVDQDSARARRRWDRACEHLRDIMTGVVPALSHD
ncbi:TetR/AcrR family transcriptional regulator [Mycobacterium shimoidei]|uniref:Putative transcriptional regulator [Nocardia brasiliensis ATCC] n=1 Tax=Mycobacterium shimoidei TaxID=29313 RepID=A0A1E3T1F8_MYCSH|nr:TetR/AcrR family transcriptional regulator [Mycobacterium shimoidei]MCV7261312.1 TetR/AcrR family transcriptional regulator [Mycobacterium shimoidei]ODR07658.1 transcriptional regulator [Mycobacterium shimoidei]ORW83187.1 transcriptional regulator [Mycobacterium shimoidei]SRX95826.1 putative transcriptional regulator [Nocardia brasiliensis ATCC] [Mycobacterium shimoidei]